MFASIDKEGISFSIRNGLYMPFMYKGSQVVVHNASWSFREKVWVDDELVVNQLGFAMASTHVIEVAGDKVAVTFGSRKRMSEVFLEARVGDELIYEVSHEVAKAVKPSALLLWAIVGGVLGMGVGYLIGSLIGGA
jgi:hypothetical protein